LIPRHRSPNIRLPANYCGAAKPAMRQALPLFSEVDDLIGAAKKRAWHGEAARLGGVEI
jgi:hypothetical protein